MRPFGTRSLCDFVFMGRLRSGLLRSLGSRVYAMKSRTDDRIEFTFDLLPVFFADPGLQSKHGRHHHQCRHEKGHENVSYEKFPAEIPARTFELTRLAFVEENLRHLSVAVFGSRQISPTLSRFFDRNQVVATATDLTLTTRLHVTATRTSQFRRFSVGMMYVVWKRLNLNVILVEKVHDYSPPATVTRLAKGAIPAIRGLVTPIFSKQIKKHLKVNYNVALASLSRRSESFIYQSPQSVSLSAKLNTMLKKYPAKIWQIGVLLVTVIISIGFMLYFSLHQRSHHNDAEQPVTTVVFATKDLPRGTTLTSEHIMSVPTFKESVPDRAFGKVKDAIGQTTTEPVAKGQILEWEQNALGVKGSADNGTPRLIQDYLGRDHDGSKKLPARY